MSPSAEIIAVGSELLTPLRSDTNGLWLTEQLNRLGIEVAVRSIVGDDLDRLTTAFKDALSRSRVVLSTGGLGPTLDDLTRDALSAATGRPLLMHHAIVERLRERFASRGREMTENNARQGLIPEGAEALPNPDGTAPGIRLVHEGVRVALMPGPPREMRPMFLNHVLPWLKPAAGENTVVRRTLRVTGIGESAMDTLIGPLYSRTDNPTTTINFTAVDLEIHLTARAPTAQEADTLIVNLIAEIAPALGDKLYSTDDEPLEQVVGQRLKARGLTIVTAESLTGGLIAERLTRIPGSSAYVKGALVTYTDEMKAHLLNVPTELLEQHGAVSAPVAEAMAQGARQRTGADLALSATGFAGPEGERVGTVFIGLSGADGTRVIPFDLLGDRELVRLRASQAALFELLRGSLS